MAVFSVLPRVAHRQHFPKHVAENLIDYQIYTFLGTLVETNLKGFLGLKPIS